MNDFLKMDVFFFVATICMIIFTIASSILIIKLITLANKAEGLTEEALGLVRFFRNFGKWFKK
jgi:hypothetical protein